MNLQDFKNWLIINCRSKKTIKTYYGEVKRFFDFSKGNINQDLIDKYLLYQKEIERKQSGINIFLNSIKTYFKYANLDFILPKQKNLKPSIKSYWTLEELNNDILRYFTLIFNDYQFKVDLFKIMFYTGLRPEELKNLQYDYIDFVKNRLIVKDGKGNKDRIIPLLGKEIKNILSKYKNKQICNLNYRQLNYVFKKVQNELSLDYQITPYIMRRSFAKYCLFMGLDISEIKILMGHENIKTTEIYVSPDDKMIQEKCDKIFK